MNYDRNGSGKGRSCTDAGTVAPGIGRSCGGQEHATFCDGVWIGSGVFFQGSEAQADLHAMKAKWDCFWHRVHVDWHRNNAWPEPFNLVDREAVRVPLATMVDRGWQLQNTIPDELSWRKRRS